ncbi:tetratricopeptide repeat protein [Streptomyces sp. SS8]
MTTPEARWEQRLESLWASFDDHGPDDFLRRIEALAAELPPGDAVALYELASAHDAVAAFLSLALTDAGREREAAALALTALVPHLPEYRRSLTHYARALTAGDGA